MSALQAIPAVNPSFTVREIGDEMIFISDKGDMLHTLNAVGASLWRHIDGKRSVQDILALLIDEYDVPESRASKDIQRFFDELAQKEIVQWVLRP